MKIVFSNSPWWLLLIIPAIILGLLPHLKLAKRYRRTRNRITSIVLHLIVMVLAILTMAGLEFHSMIPNDKNEIILLVDVSDTEEQSKKDREDFIQQVLEDGQYDNYRVGVVTFGYDQVYAVPLTYDVNSIYNTYLHAETPDTTATNIADALEYTRNLFDNPATGKIVLITDGKETDKSAVTAIRAVASQGTKLDVAYIPSEFDGEDVQIVGIELPEYHVNVGEECTIKVLMQSNVTGNVTLKLEDKGEGNSVEDFDTFSIGKGSQVLSFKHTFTWGGLHEICFTASFEGDVLEENNVYSTYLNLELFNKVLVLESVKGASATFTNTINETITAGTPDGEEPITYEFTIMHVEEEGVPKTVEELRLYDQVILNNIANSDLKKISADFDKELEEYVSIVGGGLFTIGGHESDGISAHAYNRKDMGGTVYQQMLPVQAINYTPPVAVMIVIDRSGSMNESDSHGDVKLESAKAGAASCLSALSERDYVGIMTLDESPEILLPFTSRVKEHDIRSAINKVASANDDMGTNFTDTIIRAGQALRGIDNVAKRHILLVTDGEPNDKPEDYEPYIRDFYETNGITFSVVMIENPKGSQAYNLMKQATTVGGGETYAAMNTSELALMMKQDLNSKEITEVVIPDEGFSPMISSMTSPLVQGLERVDDAQNFNKLNVKLDGFFGVKERSAADVILVGDFNVPIYAQWAYGQGMVGSFMCDLTGVWSKEFIGADSQSSSGKEFICNVINNLMPTESIRAPMMNYKLTEDNYTNQLSVFTAVDTANEYIKAEIKGIDEQGNQFTLSLNEASAKVGDYYVVTPFSKTNGYSRCEFVVKGAGVYEIVLTKCKLDGTVIKENGEDVVVTIYKSFGHSEEYDAVEEDTSAHTTLEYLASRANGVVIQDLEDPEEIFEGFVTELPKVFDPRYLFMILAITLFLADIAVRKFKFKWPHEIIRGYQEKKKSK